MHQAHEEQRSSFRLDVPLHQLLTNPVSERVEFQPIGVAQRFPDPVFPQHPESLGEIQENTAWTPPEKRHWTAGQIYRTMQGWLFPTNARLLRTDVIDKLTELISLRSLMG